MAAVAGIPDAPAKLPEKIRHSDLPPAQNGTGLRKLLLLHPMDVLYIYTAGPAAFVLKPRVHATWAAGCYDLR